MIITNDIRERLNQILDLGLTTGLGQPEPGKFCAEAAVCYALGEPHSDSPSCVHAADRALVIKLNDSYPGTEKERAAALRNILLAHLGTAGRDRTAWVKALVTGTIKVILPLALYAAADVHPDADHQTKLRAVATRCAEQGTKEAANAAADAAYYAADAADAAYYADAAYCAAADADYYAAAHAAYYAAYYAAYAAADAAANANAAAANAARRAVWDKFVEVVEAAYAQEAAQ